MTSKQAMFKERLTFEDLLLEILRNLWRTLSSYKVLIYYDRVQQIEYLDPSLSYKHTVLLRKFRTIFAILKGINEISEEAEALEKEMLNEIADNQKRIDELFHKINDAEIYGGMNYNEYRKTTYELANLLRVVHFTYTEYLTKIISLLDKHGLLLKQKVILKGEEQYL